MRLKSIRLLSVLICTATLLSTGAATGPNTPSTTYYAYVPAVLNNYPFYYGTSRYMSTTNVGTLQNLGCQEGQKAVSGATTLVILDFGQPIYDSATGRYGSWIFNGSFRSTGDIEAAAEGYLNSYYLCSPQGAFLRLVIGTSNFRGGTDYVQDWTAHGAAWAQMINNITAWISAPPSIASKVSVRGGNDFEQWNQYATPTLARNWINGYTATYTGTSYVYNYGACSGCAFTGHLDWTPSYGWSYEDIWYVSYGARPAWPVPEIYLTNGINADQWYRMSLYGYTNHGQAMNFIGSLTQWQACQTNGPCNTVDNTPQAGWSQLFAGSTAIRARSRRPAGPAISRGKTTKPMWQNKKPRISRMGYKKSLDPCNLCNP
ncbi:MAG: hypothetical protein M1140_07335 [Chloroflexi bacterium]|nr:hypothetical protein [Chloroflexota bacterium]